MTTPGKHRHSGILGPGRISSIPTPGRSRSSSSVYQHNSTTTPVDDISRAFADAIKANDPSLHRNIPQPGRSSTMSLSPQSASYSLSSGRRSVVGRPSSASSVPSTSTAPSRISERSKTPTSTRIISRPPSRHSDVVGKAKKAFEVGDNVRIESLGFEGTLRYLGEIDGKPGLWAGIELSGGFGGKGKNNGTVGGSVILLSTNYSFIFLKLHFDLLGLSPTLIATQLSDIQTITGNSISHVQIIAGYS